MSALRSMVTHIVQNAQSFEWRVHGIGMMQLYLPNDVRLHIWDKSLITRGVSLLHTHAWDFRSHIVGGHVSNHVYSEADPQKVPIEFAETYNRGRIKCGPEAVPFDVTLKLLISQGIYRLGPGSIYEQKADEIHYSDCLDGTITVVERYRKVVDSQHAYVYWLEDEKFVTAKPRSATAEEISRISIKALGLLR